VQPGSVSHQISDFVMASLRAGFVIDAIQEFAPDATLAARFRCAPFLARIAGQSPTPTILPTYIG
jgi:hypothetical protein